MNSTDNNIPFSDIFRRKETLAVCLANNMYENLRIVSKILCWIAPSGNDSKNSPTINSFKTVYFFLPGFQKDFFAALLSSYNVQVEDITSPVPSSSGNIVINLNNDNKSLKNWTKLNMTVILGLGKYVNVKFLPPLKDTEKIIGKVAELLNLPSPMPSLDLKNTPYKQAKKDKADSEKAVLAVNSFWKRRSIVNSLRKKNRPESSIILCPTRKQLLFAPDHYLTLREIVSHCYEAQEIFTDDDSLKELLDYLGFKTIRC